MKMIKMMNWLMLSCIKSTELMEKESIVGLSRKEKLQLRLHTSMCDGCRAYQKQSALIDKLLKNKLGSEFTEIVTEIENNPLKDRILLNLPKQ